MEVITPSIPTTALATAHRDYMPMHGDFYSEAVLTILRMQWFRGAETGNEQRGLVRILVPILAIEE